jgi:hypothetical protein
MLIRFAYAPLLSSLPRADSPETTAEHPHKAPLGGRSAEDSGHRARGTGPQTGRLDVSPLRCSRAATPDGARNASEHRIPFRSLLA